MTKRLITWLSVILVCQVAVAFGLTLEQWDHSDSGATNGPLLAVDFPAVDKILINQDKDHQVVLARKNGHWVMPKDDNLPVNEDKLKTLIGKLKGLRHSWAVADTADSAKRFKVTDSDHQRKIVLSHNGTDLATVYLGTSPGFRRTHVRIGDKPAIYEEAIATYEAPTASAQWLDKQLLKVSGKDLKVIKGNDYTLDHDKSGWTLAQLDAKHDTNSAQVSALLDDLKSIRIESVLGKGDKPAYHIDKPTLTLAFTKDDGKTLTYRFGVEETPAPNPGKATKDAKKAPPLKTYIVKSSARPEYFKLAQWQYQRLLDINRGVLSVPKPAKKTAATSDKSTKSTSTAAATPAKKGVEKKSS